MVSAQAMPEQILWASKNIAQEVIIIPVLLIPIEWPEHRANTSSFTTCCNCTSSGLSILGLSVRRKQRYKNLHITLGYCRLGTKLTTRSLEKKHKKSAHKHAHTDACKYKEVQSPPKTSGLNLGACATNKLGLHALCDRLVCHVTLRAVQNAVTKSFTLYATRQYWTDKEENREVS